MKLRLKSRLTTTSLLTLILVIATASILLFRLGSLNNGLAQTEMQLPSVSQAMDRVFDDPILLPYTITQLIVALVVPGNGYTATRLPAALLGGLTAVLIFWVLKQWYGQRLALFGTLLLITAPWFLHIARIATPMAVYPLAMAVILVLAVLWHRKERPKKLLYITGLAAALLLYIPGAIWLVLCLALVERRNIIETIKTNKTHTAIAFLITLVAVAPLVHYLLQTSGYKFYLIMFGYAGDWSSVAVYAKEYASTWVNIFAGGYRDPIYNLAGLPLVNIFITLSFAVGVYLYSLHPKAARTQLLLFLWLIGTAVVALPNNVSSALLLPIVSVLATGGIGYLLHLWLKVFPKNPIARGFGIGLVALVVVFAVSYNLRGYFIAWPNNPDTRQTFSRQL